MWHLIGVLWTATVSHLGREGQTLTNVVSLFMLMLCGAWLFLELLRVLHLCAQVGVDAQSLCLGVTLEIGGTLTLS